MNNDDQLLQFLDEEEYVIKTESYSTVVNSFQNPLSLSKNNQTNSASLKRLLVNLASGVTISKPDGRLNNIVPAIKSARSEAETQTLKHPAPKIQPRIEKQVYKKDKNSSGNASHERIVSSFIFQKAKVGTNTCCDRCRKKGLKVCEKHSPTLVPAIKEKTRPALPEVPKKCPEKAANQNTLKNTCLCSDHKSSQAHKSLIIMSSGRCNRCNRDASITSMCIDGLFNQAKVYLQQLAEEHKSKCPRCNQRRSCQSLTAQGSSNSSCKELLFEQAREFLTNLACEHKTTCDRCKKKEPQQQKKVCPALREREEVTSKPSYVETMIQQAWSYIQNLRAGKKFCCHTNKDCCPRCMKLGLSSCCKHSSDPNSCQGICKPCKPTLKPPECSNEVIDCPRFKKANKSVCLIECPSSTANKNICQHCKKSLGLDSENSCCARCKKDGMPVCCKHQEVPISSSSDTTCSSKSINSLLERIKKHTNDSNKSCPKLCKKKSSEECFPPVPRCKSAEQCSFDPCEASQSCCKKKLAKKPSCTGSCSKSSESFDDSIKKPCIGPCTKKCPLKRSGCDFLEYHSSTRCSGPCQSTSVTKKMTGIKLTITPKMSDEEFCKHSCDAVKKVFCPDIPIEAEEPQGDTCTGACCPQGDTCTGPCCQPEEPQGCNDETCQDLEQAEEDEEEPEPCRAPCTAAGCIECNSQYSSSKVTYIERRMVDANYEAFLDDQFGRMVAKQLADKETLCDEKCDCITCLTNLKLKSAHSDDLNKYRFYY